MSVFTKKKGLTNLLLFVLFILLLPIFVLLECARRS